MFENFYFDSFCFNSKFAILLHLHVLYFCLGPEMMDCFSELCTIVFVGLSIYTDFCSFIENKCLVPEQTTFYHLL